MSYRRIRFASFNETRLEWTSEIEARSPWLRASGKKVLQYCCKLYDPNVCSFFQVLGIMIHTDILNRRLCTREVFATNSICGANRRCGLNRSMTSFSIAGLNQRQATLSIRQRLTKTDTCLFSVISFTLFIPHFINFTLLASLSLRTFPLFNASREHKSHNHKNRRSIPSIHQALCPFK